uniref:Uncharacterized protein n=1 Tax=Rhizophora mucronata TaxID=61149 RepID=A0A2P2N705_RHIMU
MLFNVAIYVCCNDLCSLPVASNYSFSFFEKETHS